MPFDPAGHPRGHPGIAAARASECALAQHAAAASSCNAWRCCWCQTDVMALLARRLGLDAVMDELRRSRTLFHSEADFQHSFAMTIAHLDPALRVRLEVPFREERASYLDLLVTDPGTGASTAIELKYSTQRLEAKDPLTGESFHLRFHAAYDLARLHFVRDIRRLERWAGADRNGVALMLSNVRSLWSEAAPRTTQDQAFRLHQDRRLGGCLVWGANARASHDVEFSGSYTMS